MHNGTPKSRGVQCGEVSFHTGAAGTPKKRFSPKTPHQTTINRVQMWDSTW